MTSLRPPVHERARQDDGEVDAVGADGRIVRLRPVVPGDADALRGLHRDISETSLYLRFFGLSRSAAMDYAARLATPSPDREALAAWLDERLVGVAPCERIGPVTAEVALLVADECHRIGIGTLLLEHLGARARARGITRFTADVLAENGLALRTLRDIGFRLTTRWETGTAQIAIDLRPVPGTLDSIEAREASADRASLRHLLAPSSVAVIGAGNDPASVGHQVLQHILDGGFTGQIHAVNPHHDWVLGVRCVPGPASLPPGIDLAVIAVPAERVPDVVRGCGQRSVRALLVLTAGFDEMGDRGMGRQAEVVGLAWRYGMRLVGPNCLGLLNTDPSVRLNATLPDCRCGPAVPAWSRSPGHRGARRDGPGGARRRAVRVHRQPGRCEQQ